MGSHLVIDARRPSGDVVLTFEFLEASNRRFYWRAVVADGSISQESAETFLSLEECAADATRAWVRHD